MKYDTFRSLLGFSKYGSGICFPRFYKLAEEWEIDLSRFSSRSVHITGSNGKGSTAEIVSHLLSKSGLQVGLFTSPHLYEFNERFRINGEPISDATLKNLIGELKDVIDRSEWQNTAHESGAFEIITLLAAKYFSLDKLDAIIWEAGIGGRLDPTKCFNGKVAALVSLDHEHTELLSDSLERIAYEKSDIVANDSILVVGDVPEELLEPIRYYNLSKGTTVLAFNHDFFVCRNKCGKPEFTIRYKKYCLPAEPNLFGYHQIHNASLAAVVSLVWLERFHADRAMLFQKDAPDVLSGVTLPGRLEQISTEPLITIDAGHSPKAVSTALREYLELVREHAEYSDDGGILVVGVSHNKAVEEIVSILAPRFSIIVCTAAYKMGTRAKTIFDLARRFNKNAHLIEAPTMQLAVKSSITCATEKRNPIYVAGGLFLAVEFKMAFVGLDPQELSFF